MSPVSRLVSLSLLAAALPAWATPVIDDSPTRVQTTLKVDLRPVGTLRPKSIAEVSSSRWTLDCGGMDREHADWRAVREYVAPLGIARIRQQAGWARCEKDPGKYDFAWLDQVVFDAKRMGVAVWMELSYGNPAYPGGGGRTLAAGIPTSPEGLAAWDRWVEQMARRYAGTVGDWCVWNEPDLRGANEIGPLTDFAIRTAEIVRREIPAAKIAAFALTHANPKFVEPFVKELARRGKAGLFSAIAYHHYNKNPDDKYENVERCRKIVARHTPNLKLMQGEGGTWSEWGAAGALQKNFWTELTQAKYDLRRSLGDLGHGDDTEVFHLCDLEYRTSGFHDGLVRYGLLKTTGQADGYRVLKVKTAYYAIQNAVSVFNDAMECLDHRTTSTLEGLERPAVYDWRDRKTGVKAVVFWNASAMPQDENATRDAELTIDAEPFAEPVWCDLLTGDAYVLPSARIQRDGVHTIYTVPVYDSPTFVTDRKLLSLDRSWRVRYLDEEEAKNRVTGYGVTAELQKRIDAAAAAGGGTVTLEAGEYPVATLFLRSNVTLELKKGATLVGSTNMADYVSVVAPNRTDAPRDRAIIGANGVTNVALVGEGRIDGRGWALGADCRAVGRWKACGFYRVKGVRIEGVTIENPASWTCHFRECEDVYVNRVTIRALRNWNNDGIDIEAKNVLIENCDIDADDDAICPKSDNPNFICENVEVRNCRLASNCNHIKLGTSSHGGFRNIWIHDCELVPCATNIIPQIKNGIGKSNDVPGWDKREIGSRCGIAVECVDGGIVENVRISDIRMNRSCQTPIFVRLGRRRDPATGKATCLKNVVIENVTGETMSWLASSVTGVPGLRPQNVTIRNVTLKAKGGGLAEEVARPVPEAEKGYPENRMFGRQMLPGYGFYVRHADGVKFENVKLSYTGEDEGRPAVFADDSTGVTFTGCDFQPPKGKNPKVMEK